MQTQVRGVVAPDRLAEGIGSFLLEWELGRARSRIAEAPREARVSAKASVEPRHVPTVDLLSDNGFTADRYFLEMRIDFADPPPQPGGLPDGLRLVGFDPDEDLERLFDAIDEAFRDHYGYVEGPRDEDLERFRRFLAIPSFDPSLVWMALDGDEIAGNAICLGEHEGDESVGYVANIAVRRPWRGRGLAKAMLAVCFAELAGRGKKAVALVVDADSLTGATRLYESVGMREVHRSAEYGLELRSGEDLTVS